MKTTILKQSLLLLSSATLLAACGGDGGDSPVDDFGSNPGESGAQALLYAYPDNGQGEVPTKAPIALRFTSAVSTGDVKQNVTLCCDDQGGNLDFDADSVGTDPRGVLITPKEKLAPGTQYTVEITDLRLQRGTAKDETLTFTTRTLQEGPKSLVVQDMDSFELSRTIPNDSKLEPVMDFSAFRFQFTQPIDRATAKYGDGNTVVLRDSDNAEVEASLLVDGAYMTVDPEADYLTPGETYTLTLGGGLMSTYGESFAEQTIEFQPKDSSPRGDPGFLVQRITQSGTSRLTGKAINQVPVNGTLLGEGVNFTQAEANRVIAELADVTQYTEVTPIRLPKGTLLKGQPIDMVMVGGTEEAGFGSGAVTMRILSDATGYLVPNPYTDHQDNLRLVHLFMDVGIATENPKANGGFTQNLLHIHLVGVAEVDPINGVLDIDATSMVEPDILGQEYGYGLLSFQLQSYKDQSDGLLADARADLEDNKAPVLQSWTLGVDGDSGAQKEQLYTPGDSITLNFDEPLDPESVENQVQLARNGSPVEIDYYVDGAALIIKPAAVNEANEYGTTIRHPAGLKYSAEDDPVSYLVEVGSDITDLSGNSIVPTTQEIDMPVTTEDKTVLVSGNRPANWDVILNHSPLILSTYPGFPCVLSEERRDLDAGWAGRCEGGYPGTGEESNVVRDEDDSVPIMDMPGNRPIVVQFSKDMMLESFVLGTTFKVEERADDDSYENVPGKMQVYPRKVTFTPDDPWEEDRLYRYTVLSSGYEITLVSGDIPDITAADNFTCGVDSICDMKDGLPLQTQAIGITTRMPVFDDDDNLTEYVEVNVTGPDFEAGGPPLVQFFKGAKANNNVVQILNTAPVSDLNHSFYHDADTPDNATFVGPTGSSTHGEYEYDVQEYGPTSEPDTRYPEYDPNGVKPGKNSAKILSRVKSREETLNFPGVNGVNVGCSYDFAANETLGCPERAFTYLRSAIVAEVTDDVTDEGLKVLMWPSQVAGTSLFIYAIQQAGPLPFLNPVETGPQFLRMRFAEGEDESGNIVRNGPIEAFISDEGGELTLTATVDLYLTAPYAAERGVGGASNFVNMTSYPITMTLTGPVDFLDDGRMTVEQFNINSIDVFLKIGNCTADGCNADGVGYGDLFIPEEGSRLNFISEPIK